MVWKKPKKRQKSALQRSTPYNLRKKRDIKNLVVKLLPPPLVSKYEIFEVCSPETAGGDAFWKHPSFFDFILKKVFKKIILKKQVVEL